MISSALTLAIYVDRVLGRNHTSFLQQAVYTGDAFNPITEKKGASHLCPSRRRPEELRPFAHHVKKFNSELRDHLTSLVNQLAVLETTWRDQAQNKFVEQFEERSDFERFRP